MCPLFVLHFWDKSLLKFPKFILNVNLEKLYLADYKPTIEEKNSILVGLDYYFLFINGNVIRSENDNLVALESKLGWILSGIYSS